MYYLNENGIIRTFASEDEYKAAVEIGQATSYPAYPLIKLSDETFMRIMFQALDGDNPSPLPELDNIKAPFISRIEGHIHDNAQDVDFVGTFVCISQNGLRVQYITGFSMQYQRVETADGWQRFYINEWQSIS